jgi:hypothetical protein
VQQRKLPVNATDFLSVAAANMLDGLFNGHVEDRVALGVKQIYETFDVSVILHDEYLNSCRRIGRKNTRSLDHFHGFCAGAGTPKSCKSLAQNLEVTEVQNFTFSASPREQLTVCIAHL